MQVASMQADPPTRSSVQDSDGDGVDSVHDNDMEEDAGNVAGSTAAFGPTAKRRAVSVPGGSRSYHMEGAAAHVPSSLLSVGADAGASSVSGAGASSGPANSATAPVISPAGFSSLKRSAPAGDSGGAGSSVAGPSTDRAAASNALAERLAARTRNPNVFPAACWVPGAQAVLAAHYSRTAPGRPPVAPVVRQGAVPVGAAVGVLPHRSSASMPPPPARHPARGRVQAPPVAS